MNAKAKAHEMRLDRERGRVSGVQRQRRQPKAISKIELTLQDQQRKWAKEQAESRSAMQAILDILRSNPGFHNTYERQRVFENVREL